MNKSKLYLVPAAFLLVAVTLNLLSCLFSMRAMEISTKPLLLPLISLTFLAWLSVREFDVKGAAVLICGQLLGCAGDILLMNNTGFAFFAGGMGAFLLGHFFYISFFGKKSLKGIKPVTWLIAVATIAVLLVLMVYLIGIKGALLAPMAVYGATLMFLIFIGLMGVLKFRGPWWMVLCGAVIFLFSDSLIAMRSFGMENTPTLGFVIMLTYVVAQALLAAGAVRILTCRGKANS